MTQLTLGGIALWRPPTVMSELTGSRNAYTSSACGGVLESTDLRYKVYISGHCTLAESQEIQLQIEGALATAPNLTLTRQETPDALVFQHKVKAGSLDVASDLNDIRLRFTDRRTLAFDLSLTILPTGAGSGDFAFRHTKYLAATGDFDWMTDTIKALLVDADSTAPDEIYVTNLAGFVDLSELSGGGYARQTIAGKSVVEGSQVQLLLTNPEFTTAGGGTGLLLYRDGASEALRVPLFFIAFSAMAAGLQVVHVDLLGLW